MRAAGIETGGTRRARICFGPIRSEILKARSYPPMTVAALAIVAFSVISSAYLTYMAWSKPDEAAGLVPSAAYQLALPVQQVGFALMGALVLYMDEAQGMAPALLAVPDRGRLLAAKVATSAGLSAAVASLTAAAAYGTHAMVLALVGDGADAGAGGIVRVGVLVAWWTALSVLVTSLSLLTRRSMPVLVLALAMMLALSSVLRGITPAATWLPDQLALCLYQVPPPSGGIGMPSALAGLACWLATAYAGAWASLARWGA